MGVSLNKCSKHNFSVSFSFNITGDISVFVNHFSLSLKVNAKV